MFCLAWISDTVLQLKPALALARQELRSATILERTNTTFARSSPAGE